MGYADPQKLPGDATTTRQSLLHVWTLQILLYNPDSLHWFPLKHSSTASTASSTTNGTLCHLYLCSNDVFWGHKMTRWMQMFPVVDLRTKILVFHINDKSCRHWRLKYNSEMNQVQLLFAEPCSSHTPLSGEQLLDKQWGCKDIFRCISSWSTDRLDVTFRRRWCCTCNPILRESYSHDQHTPRSMKKRLREWITFGSIVLEPRTSLCLSCHDTNADVQADIPGSLHQVGSFNLIWCQIFKLIYRGHPVHVLMRPDARNTMVYAHLSRTFSSYLFWKKGITIESLKAVF